MGVKDLWPMLSSAMEEVSLEDLAGKRLAIDASIWLCQDDYVHGKGGNTYKTMHNRVLALLKHHIQPVFIFDGKAPSLKAGTLKKRQQIRGITSPSGKHPLYQQWTRFLIAMNIPYIDSAGEAEATCAYLDKEHIVDACVTNDADALLFGARTVIKDFSCNIQEEKMKLIRAENIEVKLNLVRDDLVLLACFLGCDYDDNGVTGVGKETVSKLLEELRDKRLSQAVKAWKDTDELAELDSFSSLAKPIHCSHCNHPGNKLIHEKKGCKICSKKKGCNSNDKCSCEYHEIKNRTQERKIELEIWKKTDKSFPPDEVVQAYLKPEVNDVLSSYVVPHQIPDYQKVLEYFKDIPLSLTEDQILQTMAPVYTAFDLEKNAESKPSKIIRSKTFKTKPYLIIEWSFIKGLNNKKNVQTNEQRDLFNSKYPYLVMEYEYSTKKGKTKDKGSTGDYSPAKKRIASKDTLRGPAASKETRRITDFFSKVKK